MLDTYIFSFSEISYKKISWMCLYPCYIDGTKTVAEGRKIPKSKACVKQPWAKDIVEALKELMLSQAFEVHLFPSKRKLISSLSEHRCVRGVPLLLIFFPATMLILIMMIAWQDTS